MLAALLLVPSLGMFVHASDASGISRPIESRIGSRVAVTPLSPARPRALETPTPPEPLALVWSAAIGAAYTDPQNGPHVWTTPFELSAEQGSVSYSLSGDGYTRPSGSATGLADPTFVVQNVFWTAADQRTLFIGGAGVTFPVGGPVGGKEFQERVLGILGRQLSPHWNGALIGSLVRAEDARPTGGPLYIQVGIAQLKYLIAQQRAHNIALQFTTVHRNSLGTGNQFSAQYNVPFSAKYSGKFTLTRGLTRGARDTSFEFDLGIAF